MTAADCLVCSGPLHDTWLGAAVISVSVVYGCAVVMAGLGVAVEIDDGERTRRGFVWLALARPLIWLWHGAGWLCTFLAEGLLPPGRQPRAPRRELEERIAELERDLGIDREENRV